MDAIMLNCGHDPLNQCLLLILDYWTSELEDLMVLKLSPDLLNNVKIGQDQLLLIMKNILFYGGYSHFG